MVHSLNARFMLWTTITVLLIVGANFLLDYYDQHLQARAELREKARLIVDQLLAAREFIARNQDSINFDSRGNFEFKHLNPAAVGRGIGEIFNETSNYTLKQTRLDSRARENAPDAFEIEGLRKFRENRSLTEYAREDIVEGKRVYRYMVPLQMHEACLQCHGKPKGEIDIAGYHKEGYELGDLGGAVSVTIPMNKFLASLRSTTFRHLGFFLILAASLLVAMRFLVGRLVVSPLGELETAAVRLGKGDMEVDISDFKGYGEVRKLAGQFQKMAEQLQGLYDSLEERVRHRTLELSAANLELQTQQEALEKANRELENANKLKSHFLAGMSHELRTPLTAIMAFSELLLGRIPPSHQSQKEDLEDIRQNGENLLGLIDNLLDMAKIEAGRYNLNIELVDPVDILFSVEKTMYPLAKKQELRFEVEIAKIPLIYCDAQKIRRVLLNIVGNAFKFTSPGGKVSILANTGKDNQLLINIKDTGIGIACKDQKVIFEPFRQVDDSDARKYKGTGLGLALSKELVEMHGGEIKVESELGKGSTFTILLPEKPERVLTEKG